MSVLQVLGPSNNCLLLNPLYYQSAQIQVFRVTRLLQLFRSIRLVRFISAFRELVLQLAQAFVEIFGL